VRAGVIEVVPFDADRSTFQLAGYSIACRYPLHHIIIDAQDLAGLSRFWAEVLDWKILSEREREVVIGTEATAPVGICFMR